MKEIKPEPIILSIAAQMQDINTEIYVISIKKAALRKEMENLDKRRKSLENKYQKISGIEFIYPPKGFHN